MSIQRKILLGYYISVTVIGSMAAILLHERNREQKNEKETNPQTQKDAHE